MSSFLKKIFSVENENGSKYVYKVVTVCFVRMKFRTNKKVVIVNNEEKMPEYCKVGRYTYGFNKNNVYCHSVEKKEKLVIGDFCSIAPNVQFILASDHPYKGLSTFPFKVKVLEHEAEAISKGDIIVKDDVWIGLNSIILSGVTINQGAVVAAGSVVTKDVPAYAIVGGNPAKVIKYRFEPEVVEELKKFDFSTLTEDKVKKIGEKLYNEITKDNVKEIISEIQNI